MKSLDEKVGTAQLLFTRAQSLGLQPAWIEDDGLFVINTPAGEKYVNYARSALNSQVSSSLTKNKHYTRLILARNNLPNIPYARPKTLIEAAAFLTIHKKIIVKPKEGAGAEDIHIVDSLTQIAHLDIQNYIFEKYIIGREMRYLVLNNKIIAVHLSEYGTSIEASRNLQRISYVESEWDSNLIGLSLKTANALGLQFAAVDFLVDANDRPYILEVNSVPGLKWFHAPTSGPSIDVAKLFLQAYLPQAALA